jgi:hypothetical protein
MFASADGRATQARYLSSVQKLKYENEQVRILKYEQIFIEDGFSLYDPSNL